MAELAAAHQVKDLIFISATSVYGDVKKSCNGIKSC